MKSTASTRRSRTRFLPHVESGLLTFIGATTENPSFEVNPALLSRARYMFCNPCLQTTSKKLIAKVLALPEYRDFTIEADAQELLVNTADGDARRLLNLLEQLLRAADTRRLKTLTAEFLADSLGAQIRRFDKGGEFTTKSPPLHKSVRFASECRAVLVLPYARRRHRPALPRPSHRAHGGRTSGLPTRAPSKSPTMQPPPSNA